MEDEQITNQLNLRNYVTESAVIACSTIFAKKPMEDLLFFLANAFNNEQDTFTLIMVTEDSNYLKIPRVHLKVGDILFSAAHFSSMDSADIDDIDFDEKESVVQRLQEQAREYVRRFDTFVNSYWQAAWEDDNFAGDGTLYDDFIAVMLAK